MEYQIIEIIEYLKKLDFTDSEIERLVQTALSTDQRSK